MQRNDDQHTSDGRGRLRACAGTRRGRRRASRTCIARTSSTTTCGRPTCWCTPSIGCGRSGDRGERFCKTQGPQGTKTGFYRITRETMFTEDWVLQTGFLRRQGRQGHEDRKSALEKRQCDRPSDSRSAVGAGWHRWGGQARRLRAAGPAGLRAGGGGVHLLGAGGAAQGGRACCLTSNYRDNVG